MDIATVLHIHDNELLVKDTLDSILKYVGPNVLVIYDGAVSLWGRNLNLPTHKCCGLYHNYNRNPYKNIALGLSKIAELFPNSDWYCYCEYDVLFGNSFFKEELKIREEQNYWCLGNDYRINNFKFPFLEKIVGKEFDRSDYLLGCCVFHHKKFIHKLLELDFFNKLLAFSNGFSKGFFPGFTEYDLSEHIYPTMARQLGGKVGTFAKWEDGWKGRYKQYPLRFKPDLDELFEEASIMHPLKEYDSDIRKYFRNKRCLQ
jgi:hypothetical protein